MSNLITFLDASENSHAKESILMNKLFLDVKTSAAKHNYYLNTYFDTVDHDGFDVIFDDKDTLIKTQLKSVRSDAKTRKWEIKRSVLRPSYEVSESLGFQPTPEGVGVGGGALLMEYGESNGEIAAKYFYTNAYILSAFKYGVIQRSHASSKSAVETCLNRLHVDVGSAFLSVPKAAFLKAASTDALLALMGLHGPINSFWSGNLVKLISFIDGHLQERDLPSPPNKLREFLWNEIAKLVDEPKLTHVAFEQI